MVMMIRICDSDRLDVKESPKLFGLWVLPLLISKQLLVALENANIDLGRRIWTAESGINHTMDRLAA